MDQEQYRPRPRSSITMDLETGLSGSGQEAASQVREGCAGAMVERDAFGEKLKSSPCAPCDRCRTAQSNARRSSALMVARIASGQKLKPRPCVLADSDRQGVRWRDA